MKASDVKNALAQYSSIIVPLVYIGIIVFINVAIPAIMNVLGVEPASYVNYTMFINAMILLYIMLPKKEFAF